MDERAPQLTSRTSEDQPCEYPSRDIGKILASIMLVIHATLLLIPLRSTFITVDEAMNVAAGVSYWQTGRYFIYRVNPPLTKMIAVLPALAVHPVTDWTSTQDLVGQRVEFSAGLNFTNLNRSRIFGLVCLSRLAGVIWSVVGGWLIHRWAVERFGGSAGLLALALWCFEPYVLGHAPLVTSDIPATVAGLAASLAFRNYLRSPSWKRAGWAGGLLGLAALTKFTLLIFYFLWPLLWAAEWWRTRGTGQRVSSGPTVTIGQLLLLMFVSLDVINLGYGFQGTGEALGDYAFNSRALTGTSRPIVGNRFQGTWLGRVPIPLPADLVRGLDVQRIDFEGIRSSYLSGTFAQHGWWYFYLYAWAVKLPIGTAVLMSWGILWAFRRRTEIVEDLALLGPSLAILTFISTQTGYTLHSRYALPALPYLMINAGRLVRRREATQTRPRRLVWVLLVVAVVSSLRIYPFSLSYFNEIAGGPLHGHDHLIDSNIDWGQDLLRLKSWSDEHPDAQPLGLAYFNFMLDPALVGLNYVPAPPGPSQTSDSTSSELQSVGPLPGYYAVSVSLLRGAEMPIPDGRGGFRQSHRHEFAYFREFHPIATAGFSIYIYHITTDEANVVRRRLGLPPVETGPKESSHSR